MAVEADAAGRLEVFGLNRLGQVVHRWQIAGDAWSAWAHLDGSLAAPVPDVRGMTVANALARLAAAGYSAQIVGYRDVGCLLPPGIVMLQDPPGGPAVRLSGAPIPPITLRVSEMPSLSECNG
jgi:hypothetical protein